jgi:hypothetical protein
MVRREGRGAAFRNRERERPRGRGRLKPLGSDLGLGVNGAKQRDFFDFFRVDKSLPFTEAERDLGSWAKAPVGQNVSWRGARIQRGLLRPGGPAPKGLKDLDGSLSFPSSCSCSCSLSISRITQKLPLNRSLVFATRERRQSHVGTYSEGSATLSPAFSASVSLCAP